MIELRKLKDKLLFFLQMVQRFHRFHAFCQLQRGVITLIEQQLCSPETTRPIEPGTNLHSHESCLPQDLTGNDQLWYGIVIAKITVTLQLRVQPALLLPQPVAGFLLFQ